MRQACINEWPTCFIDSFFWTAVSIVRSNVLVLHGAEIGVAVKLTDFGAVEDVVFFIWGDLWLPEQEPKTP